jgi:DNA-binding transcriptional ArsR family regulator
MATSLRQLRRRGLDDDAIALARLQQDAERRAGVTVRSIGEIAAGQPARPRASAAAEDLTARQLRRRGRYGQAALLADQEALKEPDPERAEKARQASATLKELAERPAQTEFDFFMGNVSVGHAFHDAVRDRLIATGSTPAERGAAHLVLAEVIRWLGWQSYECTRTAAEIAQQTGLHPMAVSEALALLERVGAIARVKRGRTKVITVTPEGAYRGDISNHADTVDRYRAEVLPPRRRRRTPDDEPPPPA